MELITNEFQKQYALSILLESFKEVPGVKHLVRKKNKPKGLKHICQFCLENAIEKKGAYISSDNLGVALVYPNTTYHFTFDGLFRRVRLIHNAIGWTNLFKVMHYQSLLRRKRIKGDGLYFSMLASQSKHIKKYPASELKNAIFLLADETNQNIYAETTIAKNKLIYERYGFEVYDKIDLKGTNFRTWFMIRKPKKI